MFVDRNAEMAITSAYAAEQFDGQEFLPMDNAELQAFLARVGPPTS